MNITKFCKNHNLTEGQFNGKEKIGGYLDLRGLTSIPDGFNPTVGGYLYLSGLTSIPDGFNPTVGGGLYLSGLTSIPDGFNPTVGGGLYLSGRNSEKKTAPKTGLIFFQGGACLKADGVFARVVRKRGNVYELSKINSSTVFWMVTDSKFTHAHGETLKEAKKSFRFKIESDRIKSEPITMDTVIKIQHYRIITGACEFGVKNWIEQNVPQTKRASILKNGIKAKDLLPILEKTDAYGLSRFKALLTT